MQNSALKVLIKKIISFDDLIKMVDSDGVLRYVVAYKTTFIDCPSGWTIKDWLVENVWFEACTFQLKNVPLSPQSKEEIDEVINKLLDQRNALGK